MTPHVLPDMLRPGLRLVICGSAAGAVSATHGAYYAGPGNRFWRTLFEVGLTPRRLEPHEFRDLPRIDVHHPDGTVPPSWSGSIGRAPSAAPPRAS